MDLIGNPATAVYGLIFETLKRDDATLTPLAMEVVTRIGKDAIPTLIFEALDSTRIKYRVRLLQIIAAIGEVPEVSHHIALFKLTHDKSPEVRSAAAAAFDAGGPHGPRERARLEAAAQACDTPDVVAQLDG